MRRKGTAKSFKRLLGSMVFALALCIASIGSLKVNATEISDNGTEDTDTVDITIDNSNSHIGVRFYSDTTKMDELDAARDFEWIEPGDTQTITVKKDIIARIRLYVQADGYYVPENYVINGATKLNDDNKVNFGWCRAAFEIIANESKTVILPEASVCTHPYADPSVRWGYYDRGDGTHAQCCTLCSVDIPSTIEKHTLEEMTVSEYADWYYDDENFAGIPADEIASRKADLISIIIEDLGVDANTKIKVCKKCEYWEKIENTSTEVPSETPSTTETPTLGTETPTVPQVPATAITTSLKDTNGVLPEGTTIACESVTSGEIYTKATAAIKDKINGLGQFAVMEINLTDASNVQIHELNGYVQVSIPVPSNINVNSGKTIAVYRLEDDGSLTRCQTTVENGVITFSTNHFSTYIVVEEDTIASPKTGDDSYMNNLFFMIILVSSVGLAITVKRKLN